MAGPPPQIAVTPRGTLQITAFREGRSEPVQVQVAPAAAAALREAIDEALAAQARGSARRFGPVRAGDVELFVAATERGIRITVSR